MTPASRHHWFSFSKQETPYSRKIPSPYQAPTQPELVAQLSQLTRSVHFEVIILLWPPAFSCWSLSSFLSKKQQRYIELSKGDCKSLKIELIKWHVQKEEHLQINVFYHKICFFAFQIAATNKKKTRLMAWKAAVATQLWSETAQRLHPRLRFPGTNWINGFGNRIVNRDPSNGLLQSPYSVIPNKSPK